MSFCPRHLARQARRWLVGGPSRRITSPEPSVLPCSPGYLRPYAPCPCLYGRGNRLELAVDKPPDRPPAVGLNPYEEPCFFRGFIMGVGPAFEVFQNPLPTGWRVRRFEAGGERLDATRATEREHVIAAQNGFNGTSDFGPKLDLSGNGTFHQFARDARVQQQRIRNFHWLTHRIKVAKCYQMSSGALLGQCPNWWSVTSAPFQHGPSNSR